MHVTHEETDHRLTVVARSSAAEGVVALELADAEGAPLPMWAPGAHIDLTLESGLTRQYSLCGDPADRSAWRIGVLLEPKGRGGSKFIHDHVHEGAVLDARGPRNNFALDPAAHYVFIAGGIGITPLIPMVAAAAASGADWVLHYGGRTIDSMAFRDELLAVPDADTRVHFYPQDTTGLLNLKEMIGSPREGTLVYCCGPEALLQAVESECATWPAGALRVERFSPVEQGAPLRDESFEVVLAASGLTLTVPSGTSILEAVRAAGVEVNSSCTEGVCGTCETAVLDGEIDHRDSILSPAERAVNDVMFICVSRAACDRITLDL